MSFARYASGGPLLGRRAGRGRRHALRRRTSKQYATIGGRTIIESSLAPFVEHPDVAGIVVVLAAGTHWSLARRSPGPAGRARRAAKHGHNRFAMGLRHSRRGRRKTLGAGARRRPPVPCRERPRSANREIGDDAVGGILAAPLGGHHQARCGLRPCRAHDSNDSACWRALTPQMFRYGLLCRALE